MNGQRATAMPKCTSRLPIDIVWNSDRLRLDAKTRRRRDRSDVRYPAGPVWPEEMAADMAAAYVDEVSVAAFEAKVGSIWPLPDRRRGSRRKWSRELLLKAIRERHGVFAGELQHEEQPEKVANLI
jgi:hypothetical protein